MVTFHPATMDAARYIGEHLRQADRIELDVTSPGDAPVDVIAQAIRDSRWATLVCIDGVPALVYGVAAADAEGVGSPWLLATDDIRRIRRYFVEHCADEVRLMGRHFRVLYNQVHRDNAVSIRWLEWLGFTVDRSPTGPGGVLHDFWKGDIRHV